MRTRNRLFIGVLLLALSIFHETLTESIAAYTTHDIVAQPGLNIQTTFEVLAPPSITEQTYTAIYCEPRYGQVSGACPYAPQMYKMLVNAGIDPGIELAFAAKETEFGSTGPGREPQYNLYNITCNSWDGGTCGGAYHGRFSSYTSYLHATRAWITLMLHRGIYVDAGRTTLQEVIPIYAPSFENNTSLYIAQTEGWIYHWRVLDEQNLAQSYPVEGVGLQVFQQEKPATPEPQPAPPQQQFEVNEDFYHFVSEIQQQTATPTPQPVKPEPPGKIESWVK